MRTKIALTIDGAEHFLSPEDVKNWSDIACAYKRNDFSGVARSFSSKFEFTRGAYDMLMSAYLTDGAAADVSVAIYTKGDDLTYGKQFECKLDFTTMNRTRNILTISAIDDSIAAKIKANKGTKFELDASDATPDRVFMFDRLEMTESATYEFTMGDSDDETGALTYEHSEADEGDLVWLGNVGDEISVGGHIFFTDDQETDADSDSRFLLEAYKPTHVALNAEVVIDKRVSVGDMYELKLYIYNKAMNARVHYLFNIGGSYGIVNMGTFPDAATLTRNVPISGASVDGWCAIVGGDVWVVRYSAGSYSWVDSGLSVEEYFSDKRSANMEFDLNVGDKVVIKAVNAGPVNNYFRIKFIKSKFEFTWKSKGDTIRVPAYSMERVLDSLLKKVCPGGALRSRFSRRDPRIEKTILLAAEHIRDIENARFYSSFNDFNDFMEAVFGYTYCIGEEVKRDFAPGSKVLFSRIVSASNIEDDAYNGSWSESDVCFNRVTNKFFLALDGGHARWGGYSSYMDEQTGLPRTDRLFERDGSLFLFDGSNLVPYTRTYEEATEEYREIVFMHRTEIFSEGARRKIISDPKDITHTVDNSIVFSTIEIGYDKKDYDSPNGRDEFNFANTYTTGSITSTKKLQLISKYRADCYGIEFCAQKRNAKTSDSSSDTSVFFAYVGDNGFPDRSGTTIEGALSSQVFNGVYSPMACVRANSAYLARQGSLMLTFASSTGNTDIVIDGTPMGADMQVTRGAMTADKIEFTTADIEVPGFNDIIRFERDGYIYEGYIDEVEEHYAAEEAFKYKLLLKSITRI